MPKTSESLRDAVRLYVSRFDRITVVLPKGTKEIIRSRFGSNMGPYITSLVARDFAEKSIPFDDSLIPGRSTTVRSGGDNVPMYREGLEQVSILLPKGTKGIIKSVLGMKASPYIAGLVRADFENRGIGVDFSVLNPKKSSSVTVPYKEQKQVLGRICHMYLEGYSEIGIATMLNEEFGTTEDDANGWSAKTVELLMRNIDYRDLLAAENQEDDFSPEDLVEAVQIEKQRRRLFMKNYSIRSFQGISPDQPLNGKVFSGDDKLAYRRNYRPEKEGEDANWVYTNKRVVKGITVADRIEIAESDLRGKVMTVWQRMTEDEDIRDAWEAAAKGQDALKAYRSRQMLQALTLNIEETESDSAAKNQIMKLVELVEIYRDGETRICFMDGTDIAV